MTSRTFLDLLQGLTFYPRFWRRWVLPDLAKPGISKSSPHPRRLDIFANVSEVFVKKVVTIFLALT